MMIFGNGKRIAELETSVAELKAQVLSLKKNVIELEARLDNATKKAENLSLSQTMSPDAPPSFAKVVDEWINGDERDV